MINKSEHAVSMEKGLYELCAERIAQDEEFKAQAGSRAECAVDDALFDEYRLWQIKKTLKRVKENSDFYRRSFEKYGVSEESVNCLEDLAKLPFTYPGDISGGYGLMCTSQAEVEKPVTFFSSGSTGAKKRLFFSKADIIKIVDFLARGMNTVVGRDEGRCQVFLQNSQGRGIGGILAQSLINYGMQAWTSDLADDVEDIISLTLKNKVNVWFGEAITILRATRILSQRMDLSALGMKCIFITMTNIPDSMVSYLQKTWNCRVSTHYGLTESGWGLAVDCDVCPGYHYDELNHYVEIVHPDTGELLPYGSEGEVVLTNIARDCMPLIRYRTGDISRLERNACGGHLDVLGHIVRRKEGALRVNGRDVYPAAFDQDIFTPEDTLDYRVFIDGERFIFDVEVLNPETFDPAALASRLMALPELSGGVTPLINPLPIGSLRPYCFEKKRIMPIEVRENG